MQVNHLASGLVPYIAGAAVAAFALNYCAQSAGTRLTTPERISVQSETAQPMNMLDRSHKGDRLPSGRQTYGRAASDNAAIGTMERAPVAVPLSDISQPPSQPANLPEGCESAFSPMSAAELKTLAARCLT
jgi:hypothetical protein